MQQQGSGRQVLRQPGQSMHAVPGALHADTQIHECTQHACVHGLATLLFNVGMRFAPYGAWCSLKAAYKQGAAVMDSCSCPKLPCNLQANWQLSAVDSCSQPSPDDFQIFWRNHLNLCLNNSESKQHDKNCFFLCPRCLLCPRCRRCKLPHPHPPTHRHSED